MDEKIRPVYQAVAKVIVSTKNEPYLEIILPNTTDFSNPKWYEPSLVIRYTLAELRHGQCSTFDPTKISMDYEKVYLYEYEKAYLKPSKAVSELKEHRNHNSCPACSSMMCTTKFVPSVEPDKMSTLVCVCERCQYKWWSKPDYLK
jgi:DNA-directed RNA polymerase subunit M/transcription elongation factor TFIIS